jgi:hypothetical protein
MSRAAIAAALARDELSVGERLVAFSLASFADRDARTLVGTPAAAGRAGLKPSWFLEARELLERRGLVVVEHAATGRGRASTLWLPFASEGPWWDGDVNAELFEAVLGYSRSRGTARVLLAAMAALADERCVLSGVTTSQLCAAGGFSDRTYRRARASLIASGEVVVGRGIGGRGNANSWEITNPVTGDGVAGRVAPRRVSPPPGARPLVASVSPPSPAASTIEHAAVARAEQPCAKRVGERLGRGERTALGENRPVSAGVSGRKDGAGRTLRLENHPVSAGVSPPNPGAHRTVSPQTPAETPAETPAQTPAPNARAWSNPRTPEPLTPPYPPNGGNRGEQVLVDEAFVTERGRRRSRRVPVDLAAVRSRLRAAGKAERAAWEHVRVCLREAVGESVFAIWLDALELIAVDGDGALVLSAPAETRAWVAARFARLLEAAGVRVGWGLRFASEAERMAAATLTVVGEPTPVVGPVDAEAGADDRSDIGLRARGPGVTGRLSASGRPGGSADRAEDRPGDERAGVRGRASA